MPFYPSNWTTLISLWRNPAGGSVQGTFTLANYSLGFREYLVMLVRDEETKPLQGTIFRNVSLH